MTELRHKASTKLVSKLLLITLAMFGFGYAMVPIYNVLCEVTGLNGKTGTIDANASAALVVDKSREITVEFIATVNGGGADWEFRPVKRKITVHPGAMYTTHFFARNGAPLSRTSQAVPSVAPLVASRHFDKTECFCFTQQHFSAGEGREMPVTFVISPNIPTDVATVTLSYTLFDAGTPVEG